MAPVAPASPLLAGWHESQTIHLGWNTPFTVGPILDYDVDMSLDAFLTLGLRLTPVNDTTATTLTVSELANGTQYWFRVRATNALGAGPWSDILGPIVPQPKPSIALAEDTGSSPTDGITKNALVNVAGIAENAENFLLPFRVLQEVVDDEIRAKREMLAPTPVDSGQQFAAVRIEDQSQPRTSPVRAGHMAFIDVFPRGASVVRCAGNQTCQVAALQLHEADRIKFVRHQATDIVESDAGEDGVRIPIGQVGEAVLQGAAEGRFAGGTRSIDQNRHGRGARSLGGTGLHLGKGAPDQAARRVAMIFGSRMSLIQVSRTPRRCVRKVTE